MRKKIIELRETKNLTQEMMANLLGISRSYYGLIENGIRNPTYGLAKQIAEILGGDLEELFFDLEGYRMKQNITS